MKNLLKYEFRRSRLIFLGIAAITLFIELIYLLGFFLDVHWLFGIGLVGGILLIALSNTAILLYAVIMFNEDVSKKPGYLLFSTPRSSSQILGAKLLMTLMALIGVAILFTSFITLDMWLALREAELSFLDLFALFDDAITREAVLGTLFNGYTFFGFCMYLLSAIISFVSNVIIAYLVIVMMKTVMGNQKGKGILGVILWFAITNIISTIAGFISAAFLDLFGETAEFTDSIDFLDEYMHIFFSPAMYLPTIILSIIAGIGGFLLTKWMMDKKMSV